MPGKVDVMYQHKKRKLTLGDLEMAKGDFELAVEAAAVEFYKETGIEISGGEINLSFSRESESSDYTVMCTLVKAITI